MTMGSWFGDALDAAQARQEEEEELRRIQAQAQQNAGDVPVAAPAAAPAGAFFGQQFAQPAPPPPAPVMTPAGLEDIQAPIGSLRAQALGQPEPQGFVPTVPQGYTESPLTTAARVAEGPLQIYEGLNVDIPYYSDAMRDHVIPFAGQALNAPGSPLSGVNWLSQQLGGPDVGQTVANMGAPVGAVDVGMTFAPVVGDVPIDDVFRGVSRARGAADDIFRGAMPEPNVFGANYGAGIPPMNPAGGENVFGKGVNGAGWEPTALDIQRAAERDALAARQREQLGPDFVNPFAPAATPAEPPFPSAYPSIPEGTMGQMFPDVVREQGINPNSPAARMGAPLAYDPQFMTPPPADAAMRDLGVGPVDPLARPDMARELSQRLEGGGVPRVEPTQSTPPPASPLPEPTPLPPQAPDIKFDTQGTTVGGTPNAAIVEQSARELDTAIRSATGGGPPPSGAGGVPPAGGRRGGGGRAVPPSGGGNLASKAYNVVVDALYGPFGFDQSQWFRQLDVRTLNPLRAAETAQTFKASAEAIGSRPAAARIAQEQADRLAATGVKMNLADWKGDFLNRETMVSANVAKVIPGYEALNRGFVTSINERRLIGLEDFIKNHPKAKPAEVQTYANYLERVTGRGHFGNIDAAASKLGPLFTSLRFTASWPQRVAHTLPLHRLSDGSFQIGGSAWGEAVKDHAGFIGTGIATMALAQQAGLDVGWNPDKPNFGSITAGKQHIDIWGGGKQYVKAVLDVVNGEKNGKPYPQFLERTDNGSYKGTVAEFLRNKSGPVVGAIAAGLKDSGAAEKLGIEKEVKFLRPDFWDKGVTGKSMGWADRVGQYVVPLWVQDVAKAVMAEGGPDNKITPEGIKAGVVAGVGSFTGASVQSYAPNVLSGLRDEYKNDPRQSEANRGADYNELGPDGKAERDKLIEQDRPEEYKQAIADRNENGNPAIQQYRETSDKINQEEAQRKQEIYDSLRTGKLDGEQVRQGMKLVEGAANAKRDEARNNPDFKKAIADLDQNKVNQAMNTYYAIQNSGKFVGQDGKPDFGAIRAKQAEFIQFVGQKDPVTAQRLLYEVGTNKAATNPLDALYDSAKPLLEKYYGGIKDDYARAIAQRNNPHDDAFLALLGYGKTQTPQAAQILQQMRASLPASVSAVPAAAPVQRSVAPQSITAQPAPAALASNIGPNGRTVAEITGKPYLSDEERNWYFQSRGLPVPQAGAPAAKPPSAPAGNAYVPPSTGARLPPVAPGEFNSPTASPQQRENFINAMVGPANAYAYTGIPPSVWAAMGASESNWGRAPSVFGIKGVGSAGGANLATHEILGGKRVDMPDQFAAYNNLDDAFKHFIDLTSSGRYAAAHKILESGDWQGFLQGIVQAGYATDKTWANSIINLANHIEKNYPHINQR